MHTYVWLYTGLFCNVLWCMVTLPVTAKDTYRYIITGNLTKYRFKNGTTRFCKSILHPNYCDRGHEIFPCLTDGERDRCERCQDGYANLDPTTSDLQNRCYIFSCPENTIQVENISDPGCNLPCICDQTAGYFGKNGCLCSHVNFECGPDTFLNGDVCTACPPGSYKPGRGYGPCIQSPLTHDSAKLNKTTVQPPILVPANTTNSSKIYPHVIATATEERDTQVKEVEIEKPWSGRQMIIIVISVITLVGVFGLVFLLVVLLFRRSRKGVKCGSPERNSLMVAGGEDGISHIIPNEDDTDEGSEVSLDSVTTSNLSLTKTVDSCSHSQPLHPPNQSQITSDRQTFNIAVVFAKADEACVCEIKEEMEELVLKDKRKVKTWDFNHPIFGGLKLEFPYKFTSSCQLTLVVLTGNTVEDLDCRYMFEEAVCRTRLRKDEGQRDRVRPLHTEPENNRTYTIPFGLDSISPVEWCGPNYKDKFRDLLNCLSDAETASENTGSDKSDSPLLKS